jgi:hypothetical protein
MGSFSSEQYIRMQNITNIGKIVQMTQKLSFIIEALLSLKIFAWCKKDVETEQLILY